MVEHVSERPAPTLTGRLGQVLDAIDSGVTVQDAHERLVYVNDAAATLCGWGSAAEMRNAPIAETLARFELIDEDGVPLSREALPDRHVLAGESPEPLVIGFRIAASGVERWALVRAKPLELDGLRYSLTTFHDVTDQVRATRESHASERRYRDIVEALPVVAWFALPDGSVAAANARWLEYTGSAVTIGPFEQLPEIHPDDAADLASEWAVARDQVEPFEATIRLRRHDGIDRWHLVRIVPSRGDGGSLQGWIGTATDIDERVRATELARLVANVGLRLDESRDVESTVAAAASVAIPTLADWCLIDLVEPDGSLRRAGAAAADPERQSIVDRFREFGTAAGSDRPAARVVTERRPIFIPDLRDEEALGRETGRMEPLADLIRAMDARSAIVEPLIARGETIGAMFFVVGPERSYEPADMGMTNELASRVALAISNAQMNAAEELARRAAEASAERVERLQRLTRSLASASTRDAVAELVVREGRAAFEASGAVICVLQDDRLHLVSSDGYPPELVENYPDIPLDSTVPIAVAARESRAVWMPEIQAIEADDERTRETLEKTRNRSVCAVPLIADGYTFGTIGLSFAERREFEADDRALIEAYADLCAQALARVALTAIRERLVSDLELQRARLESLLQQLPDGLMIAEAPTGIITMANDRLEEILGIARSELHHIAGGEAYRGFDLTGHELSPAEWPLARAVRGETVGYTELEIERRDGTRIWVSKRAGPILDRDGNVVAGVAIITDISEFRRVRENNSFLATAGEILGSSLDYEETLRDVAEMAVPRIADWCAVDLLDEAGVLQRVVVSHVDPDKVALAREIQDGYPLDPDAPHGLAAVLRTGVPEMMSEIPPETIEAAARDERHLELIRALQLRSYIVAPIVAGGEILGALTFVGAESGRRFGEDDLHFAESLAARTASAIANARLFREALRYKRVLDATLDAVIMFDPLTLRISYANKGAAERLGQPETELIGAEATVVIEDLDAIGLRGLVEPLVAGSQESRTVTLSYRHRDGRSVPVEVLLQHVQPPGEAGRIVAIARDIAERLEAQANLRRLAESEHARAAELNAVIRAIGDGIFVCAADGEVTLSNPAAEDLFPQVTERSYEELLAQLDDPAGHAPRLGRNDGPVELRTRDAEERWIELSTFPVVHEDDSAKTVETIVMLRDVTAARQRQAIRDTFIGVLSHELRTPVTTIFAGSKVLARDGDHLAADTRREIFSDIVVESERLHRLVEDVIAMTRFEDEGVEVGTEPVLIQRILPVVVRSEERRWPGVKFEINLPPGLPTAVADPTYVEQVIRNLVSNAAKYGGAGTNVSIGVSSTEHEVVVSIADDGPGFPEAEAERVFELFFRSEQTASAAAGAGIGLFVCARLIRAMGGRIWATARPEGGAEFTFTLKVMAEES